MAIPLRRLVLLKCIQVIGTLLALIGLLIAVIIHPFSAFKRKSRKVPPKILQDPSYGTHEFVTVNGIKFHYVTAGDKQKPFMLFLHGFPEFWFAWRYQLKELQQDFHVVAVDMRGYGETDKPSGVHNYTAPILEQDIVELIKVLGGGDGRKCTLVAHDWGGIIAWRVVQKHSELIERFIIMAAAHAIPYERALARDWVQLGKSWYIYFFQTPWVPELLMSLGDLHAFDGLRGGKTGLRNIQNFSEEVLESYKYTYAHTGAFTPPFNYYRNFVKHFMDVPSNTGKIVVPTLLIWGEDDTALSVSMVEDHKLVCEDITIRVIPNCSHLVQQDCPELVNGYIKQFMGVED